MPRLPKHPCNSPGCTSLCDAGQYCAQHRRQKYRQQDQQRGTSAQRGYDASHLRLRILCFQRDNWRCVDCGWEPNIVSDFRQFELGTPPTAQVLQELRERFHLGEIHLHADHQVPIEQRPDLRLDLHNLRTRCNRCHNGKSLREMRAA